MNQSALAGILRTPGINSLPRTFCFKCGISSCTGGCTNPRGLRGHAGPGRRRPPGWGVGCPGARLVHWRAAPGGMAFGGAGGAVAGMQSWSSYFGALWCLAGFSRRRGWSGPWLLVVSMVCSGCLRSCRTTLNFDNSWGTSYITSLLVINTIRFTCGKKLGNIKEISKLHRIIAWCSVLFPKIKFCQY